MRSHLTGLCLVALVVPLLAWETVFTEEHEEAKHTTALKSHAEPPIHHFHAAKLQHAPVKPAKQPARAVGVKSLAPLVRKEFVELEKLGRHVRQPHNEAAVDLDKGKISPTIKNLDKQAMREQQSEAMEDQHLKSPQSLTSAWDERDSLAKDNDHGKIPLALLRLAQKAEIEKNEEIARRQQKIDHDEHPSPSHGSEILKNPSTHLPAQDVSKMHSLVNLARKAVQERDAEVTKGEAQQAADDAALIKSEKTGKPLAMHDDVNDHATTTKSTDTMYSGQVAKNIIDEAAMAMRERDQERASTDKQLAAQDHAAIVAKNQAAVAAAAATQPVPKAAKQAASAKQVPSK